MDVFDVLVPRGMFGADRHLEKNGEVHPRTTCARVATIRQFFGMFRASPAAHRPHLMHLLRVLRDACDDVLSNLGAYGTPHADEVLRDACWLAAEITETIDPVEARRWALRKKGDVLARRMERLAVQTIPRENWDGEVGTGRNNTTAE